jgi:hypothetical protein
MSSAAGWSTLLREKMSLDDLTEEQREELLAGYAQPGLAMVLSTAEGEYVIFPEGIKKFAQDHKAEAVFVDENAHVHVLREGLIKDKLMWVLLTVDPESDDIRQKKEKPNG